MTSVMDWRYPQVVEALESQDIDPSKYDILIDESSFNGEPISGVCLSSDGRYVCLPVHDEEGEMLTCDYQYRPQCFEVVACYVTWCSNGSMSYKVEVRVLRH